jgi:Uma2 family endonuclease
MPRRVASTGCACHRNRVLPAEIDKRGRECLHLPRGAVRFPIQLRIPDGFRLDDLSTWPDLAGRLEFVAGRIQYMPPCGDIQQPVCTDVTTELGNWVRAHPEFVVGSNEAGMLLGGEVRSADAGVWRRSDTDPPTGKLRRVAPVLAVEVAGEDEDEDDLLEKARWYLDHGVVVVWIVLPEPREVVVVTQSSTTRHGRGERVAAHAALPDLAPRADALFAQLDASGSA